jgi:hypothetical protein
MRNDEYMRERMSALSVRIRHAMDKRQAEGGLGD